MELDAKAIEAVKGRVVGEAPGDARHTLRLTGCDLFIDGSTARSLPTTHAGALVNASTRPNCRLVHHHPANWPREWRLTLPGVPVLVAAREIAAGEELLWRCGVSMRKYVRDDGDDDTANDALVAPSTPAPIGSVSRVVPPRSSKRQRDAWYASRVASNNELLAAEPRRRWADNGTRRVSLGTLHAYKLQAYVRDPTNRDARGRLRMDCGVALDGFVGYINNHATETGARHSDDEQLRHSVLIPHELLETAYEGLPGLHALVDGGLRQLPDNEADGHAIVPLHAHVLEQTSPMVCFSDHQDIEEEGQPRAKWADRRVVFTMVLVLNSGGVTSFCILGQDELFYNDEPGSGVIFKSTLWHRTMRVGVGTWKLAVFYGYLL